MSRNGSGSYTLPSAVNPVVDGTTISTTWANTTLNDLATALTDSLDRNGKGEMLAPIVVPIGSAAAPTYRFTGDTNTGLYHPGADDVRISIGGAELARWASGQYTISGACEATGNFRGPLGAADSPSYSFTGDVASGLYLAGVGDVRLSIAEADVLKVTAAGAEVTGTLAVSSTVSSKKITATGTAGNAGGAFANGTAATGAARTNALEVTNGDITLDGVVAPAAATAIKNKLTPSNIVKAWARVQTDGAGNVSLLSGFNISAIAVGGGGSYIGMTLASPMADATGHAVVAMQYQIGAAATEHYYGGITGAAFDDLRIYGNSFTIAAPSNAAAINFAGSIRNFFVIVTGKQ